MEYKNLTELFSFNSFHGEINTSENKNNQHKSITSEQILK